MCANGSKLGLGDMVTGVIDAKEGRDVAIIDLPGAFLHALNDEEIVMVLKGPLAKMMAMVDPSL